MNNDQAVNDQDDAPTYLDILDNSLHRHKIDKYEYSGDKDKYYEHKTYRIKSLSEYIDLINTLATVNEKDSFPLTLIYRGINRLDYKLEPSIARKDYNFDPERCEYKLVNDFIGARPAAFKHCSTNFELLSEMQHYGLPTRLLDFTFNPLVALYFACKEAKQNNEHDGRVVMNASYITNDTSRLSELVCSFYKHHTIKSDTLEKIVPYNMFRSYFNYVYTYSGVPNQIVARPKYWNERQVRQESVFMVFTNKLYDCAARDFLRDKNCVLDELFLGMEDLQHVYKESINRVNINESIELLTFLQKEDPIYTDILDHQKKKQENLVLEGKLNDCVTFNSTVTSKSMRRIFEYYNFNNQFPEQLKNRFCFCSDIQPISNENMEQFFVSILIDKNYKQSILNELSRIGMKNSFIFPELEYLAKDIVDKNRVL